MDGSKDVKVVAAPAVFDKQIYEGCPKIVYKN